MIEVGFGLGSNIGDRIGTISQALDRLFSIKEIGFSAASSFYRTAPWGYEDQETFVNVCAVGRTSLGARRLLDACKEVEQELGRRKTFHWGPRVIDVDILYLGGEEVLEADLAIPHKELFNRAFVLRPLAEIRPDLVLSGRRIAEEAKRFQSEEMPVVAPPWMPER